MTMLSVGQVANVGEQTPCADRLLLYFRLSTNHAVLFDSWGVTWRRHSLCWLSWLLRCTGISAAEVATEAPPPDEAQFVAIWDALCEGRLPAPMAGPADGAAGGASALTTAARHEKYVKGKLSVAADHFNRDYKKGFQYLEVVASSRPDPNINPGRAKHRSAGRGSQPHTVLA
jgi:hypothetical protein